MEIGRKIFFDKSNGNVILDTDERSGDVVETTIEQDFQSYVALSERVPSSVGFVQLTYGQYSDKFGVYHYHVDPVTNSIVWGELIDVNAPVPQPTSQELKDKLEHSEQQRQSDSLTTFDVLATIYEELLMKS